MKAEIEEMTFNYDDANKLFVGIFETLRQLFPNIEI